MNLLINEFTNLVNNKCYYCGDKDNKCLNGADRLKNEPACTKNLFRVAPYIIK